MRNPRSIRFLFCALRKRGTYHIASSVAEGDGGDITFERFDGVHEADNAVVDGAPGVEVDLDVFLRVLHLHGHHRGQRVIGNILINRRMDKDDPIRQQILVQVGRLRGKQDQHRESSSRLPRERASPTLGEERTPKSSSSMFGAITGSLPGWSPGPATGPGGASHRAEASQRGESLQQNLPLLPFAHLPWAQFTPLRRRAEDAIAAKTLL